MYYDDEEENKVNELLVKIRILAMIQIDHSNKLIFEFRTSTQNSKFRTLISLFESRKEQRLILKRIYTLLPLFGLQYSMLYFIEIIATEF